MPMYEEIALQLTLKALECGYIEKAVIAQSGKTGQEVASAKNTSSAEEIAEFFNTILATIETDIKDVVA